MPVHHHTNEVRVGNLLKVYESLYGLRVVVQIWHDPMVGKFTSYGIYELNVTSCNFIVRIMAVICYVHDVTILTEEDEATVDLKPSTEQLLFVKDVNIARQFVRTHIDWTQYQRKRAYKRSLLSIYYP